jgi:hypothetical protein
MLGGVCREIQGSAVCSYPKPEPTADDSAGTP